MQNNSNTEKDIYTLALNTILINENIDYIRVHNVELHKNIIQKQESREVLHAFLQNSQNHL